MGHTHTILTPTMIAREALRLLKNNLVMGNLVHRAYEAEFPGRPKKGGSVTIRKPVKFQVTKSRVRATSTITEDSITLTVSTQAHVSWQFTSVDLTLSIEEYSERYIRPAAAVLANTVDADLCALYDDVHNSIVDTTGYIDPDTFLILGRCMQRLDEEAVPPDDRVIVLNPAGHWSMANALHNLNPTAVSTPVVRKGYLGRIANAEIYMDQNVKTHTTGRWATSTANDGTGLEMATGAPTGASGGGTTILAICDFDISTTGVLRTGDVFTVAGAYAVNPMSGESTGTLRQFTVTADASCGSTGTTTEVAISVYIAPPMIQTGPYKTVYSFPNGGAVVDVVGRTDMNYPQNLAFHKNAFALVMVPLEKPDSTWGATVTEDGISIRAVKDYDIDADVETIRLDILYGVKTIYPELAVRLWGAEA